MFRRRRPYVFAEDVADSRATTGRDLVGPHLEADQRVRPEGLGDRNVGGVAPLRDQDAADPRHVVARIEHLPVAADIGLEPAGEIAGGPRLRRADVAEIAGAIARRNVHAAAERDGEMGVVAADALALVVGFPRGLGGARMLVAERDVTMDVIADRLHPRPARRRILEQLPGDIRQPVGLAIPAAEQINQRIRRQVLDRMLNRRGNHGIGQAAVADDAVGVKAHAPAGATIRLHQLPNMSR